MEIKWNFEKHDTGGERPIQLENGMRTEDFGFTPTPHK